MADNSRRRTVVVIIVVVVLLLALLLLLTKCLPQKTTPAPQPSTAHTAAPQASDPPATAASTPAGTMPAEALTPATLTAPAQVVAGSAFNVTWTGPANPRDYLTIVRADAPDQASGSYRDTGDGTTLQLIAPEEPGAYEARYVTDRSKTVLGRTPIEVVAAGATLDAPAEVVLGTPFSVSWTGPNNKGDYITIVPKGAPDAEYHSYADADKPSPQTITAPTDVGDAEVRYVTGQQKKVLARRAIKIIMAAVALTAPAEAVAGSTIDITWTGPNNAGDYITIVPNGTPDTTYGNYANTSVGSPMKLLLPIMTGEAELRYVTGQGNRVLARRAITINAAKITLSAAAECAAESEVSITWTGPNNAGDYITIVPKTLPDGQYGPYTMTTEGSPLKVKSPKDAGEAEIRYMTGQGNKVLARIPIKVSS